MRRSTAASAVSTAAEPASGIISLSSILTGGCDVTLHAKRLLS